MSMRRRHLIEIHDQPWCPRAIRDAETDYLQFMIAKTKPYAAIVSLLVNALQRRGTRRVLDLCSGAGGPWLWLQPVLGERGLNLTVCLTDKYPNLDVIHQLDMHPDQAVRYHSQPVDATRVPDELSGFRTMFTAFHHFGTEEARAVLSDAVRKREGIAVFEATHNSALGWLVMMLVPIMVLLMTPFIRPFRWSRLLWTYLIPVMPLLGLVDGLVSSLRTYSIRELQELTEGLEANNYWWEIGEVKSTAGPIPVTYLIGAPSGQGT